jgi:hypothetical protein
MSFIVCVALCAGFYCIPCYILDCPCGPVVRVAGLDYLLFEAFFCLGFYIHYDCLFSCFRS